MTEGRKEELFEYAKNALKSMKAVKGENNWFENSEYTDSFVDACIQTNKRLNAHEFNSLCQIKESFFLNDKYIDYILSYHIFSVMKKNKINLWHMSLEKIYDYAVQNI